MFRKIFGSILIIVSAFFLLGNLALFAPYIGGEFRTWQEAAATYGVMLLLIAVDAAVGCGGICLLRKGKGGKAKQMAPVPKCAPAPAPAPAPQPAKLFYLPGKKDEEGSTEVNILLSADGKLIEESTFVPLAFSSLDDDRDWPVPVQKSFCLSSWSS